MNIANLIKCSGLVTYGNELSRSEGSLRQALNVNIDEDGVITPRRGFNDYGLPTTGLLNENKTVSQIMEYKNSIIRQYDTSMEYEDASNNFQLINGEFIPLRSGYKTKWQEANSNLYFTSSEGVKKISENSQANLNADMVKDAGGLKAGYAEGKTIPQIGGFLPPQSKVAYRVVFGTKDNNNNLIYGSPSSRFVVTNYYEDQVTYELQTIEFDTTAGGAVTNSDYVIFYSGTKKYCLWFNTGSDSEPKNANTIGATYVEVGINGIATNDDSLAAVSANEIASTVPDLTVTLDTSGSPFVIQLESTIEGDITSMITSDNTKIPVNTTVTGNTVTGSSSIVEVKAIVPEGANVDYFYQVYRTAPISVSEGLTLNDIDPGDEMNLVYEAGLTDAEILASEIVVEDSTPDSFRNSGLPLYTNEASGEGILQANEVPPICLDMELFKNYMFYANTKQRHKLEFTVVSVDNFISNSTKFIIGNDEVTRYYKFVGEAQVESLSFQKVPYVGDYLEIYSANDTRQYYIYFGDSEDDPEITGAVGYRVNISDLTEGDVTLSNREVVAQRVVEVLTTNVDFEAENSSDTVTFTYQNNGSTTGLTEGLDSNNSFTVTTTTIGQGEQTSTYYGGDVLKSGLTSVGQAIDETARSLVKVISSDPNSPVNAYYLSTGEELPGNILLEARSLEDKSFYITIEETSDTAIGDEFTPELPYSRAITQIDESGTSGFTTITYNSHGYSNGQSVFVGYYKNPSNPGDPESFSGIYTISNVTTNTFDIELDNTGVSGFSPDYSTIFIVDVESDNEELPNRIYYSKFKQPEAVPTINFIDIGPQDSEILRILALRDELYILKEDGIYVLSGTSAPDPQTGQGGWNVRLVDSAEILAPDSAVVLNNQIYCLSDQGVIRISGSSAAVISRGIENRINQVVDSNYDYVSNTFGIAYENDRAYILFTPQQSSDTSATQAYRYNIFEKTWSRWEYEATCGLVLKRDNKLYVGNNTRNYISQERKNFDRTDFSDRNFSATININGVTGTTVELSTLIDVSVNDVIYQTQDVTIYYINWKLLKKMDKFDTGITPPAGFDTMYEAFSVSAGDNLPQAMERINDHLVTLDPLISSKTFNYSNIKAQTELLVSELNLTDAVTSVKTYSNPTTHKYEAYITEIDRLRNQMTIHTERPFVEGDIQIFKGYTCTIEWNPLHFGNPAALKQISYMTIMFDQNNFYKGIAKFYSDASQGVSEIEFDGKGVGYWGDMPWGSPTAYWGGSGNDIPYRTIVPRSKQKCRYISIAFEHKIAREYFRVIGVSADVRQISSKAYRQMK